MNIPREFRHITDSMPAVDVTPRGDQVMHEMDDDCPCGPRLEPVELPLGQVGWIRVHHSLDGREEDER